VTGAPEYLGLIVPAVVRRLEERRARVPQAELEAARGLGPRPSFADAVGAAGISLIAEIKRASPSRGPIRPRLEVAEVAAQYEAAGARAVSVLTEEDFFRGSLADLRTAAECTALPLLRKDFVVDAYQIHEARVFGASAVLLIAALLDDRQLSDLAALTTELAMDVLLEVHDAAEMARAVAVDGAVIGINNRDLHTFAVSLETTGRLAELVPAGRLLVSESGIRTRHDVERLAALGVDGVLVGESLLVEADTSRAVRALMDAVPAVGLRSAAGLECKEAG
jgi:indole-3-glycerol phosphate synthase